jgi:hypothetical protein
MSVCNFNNQKEIAVNQCVFATETELIGLGQTRRIFWLQSDVQGMVEFQLLFMQLYGTSFSQVPEMLFHNIPNEVKMGLIKHYQHHQQT